MSREKQIGEMTESLCDIQCKGLKCNVCDRCGCEYRMLAEALYNAGYRKQSEGIVNNATATGEWKMFSLITSTYYGKQYYFLNEDGSVYSRASHSNMSRDEAINEFLDIFRY